MSDSNVLTIYTDGAARGNPGPAAYSYVITRDGQTAVEESGCLGDTTNNIAEYTALVKALERARTLGGRRLVVHSDSELMVKQMLGDYKVKNEGLRPLYQQAQKLVDSFDDVSFRHVRREQNQRADELCNEALDSAAGGSATKGKAKKSASRSPARPAPLAEGVREDILDCLRSVACAWAAGNPNVPRPEEVWEQLWTILEDAGVVAAVKPRI
jgi:ribonuclease HI